MNAFGYVHKMLVTDMIPISSNPDLLAQVRSVAYNQILTLPILRQLASLAAGRDSNHEWSPNDLPQVIELIRSADSHKRAAGAILLAILWNSESRRSALSRVCIILSEKNAASVGQGFEEKVEAWLDSISFKLMSTLSDLAFSE